MDIYPVSFTLFLINKSVLLRTFAGNQKYSDHDGKNDISLYRGSLGVSKPVQKVLIVTSLQERFSPKELRYISIKSSITAALILVFFLFLGEVTFSYVFHVELYSFQITCGAVLMYNGLSGLLKGFFLKVDEHIKLADLTTVPIAIPMIAGPATITAARYVSRSIRGVRSRL